MSGFSRRVVPAHLGIYPGVGREPTMISDCVAQLSVGGEARVNAPAYTLLFGRCHGVEMELHLTPAEARELAAALQGSADYHEREWLLAAGLDAPRTGEAVG